MDRMSRACAVGGRILILLSAVLAVIMPWTENVWHFDKFPYGGEDFELSVFLTVTIFGLVLVLLQHGKQDVTFILALRQWLSSVFQGADSPALESLGGLVAALHAPPLPGSTLGNYNLPIQV
jgi:hypothetical protein